MKNKDNNHNKSDNLSDLDTKPKKRSRRNIETSVLVITSITLALAIVALSLSYATNLSFILLIVFIPLLSAVFSLKSTVKYQVFYCLILLITLPINYVDFIFFLIPNTLIGILYGNLLKRNLSIEVTLISVVTLSTLFNIGSTFILKDVFGIDIFQLFNTFFFSEDTKYPYVITMLLELFIAITSTYVIYLILETQIYRFTTIKVRKENLFLSHLLILIYNLVMLFISFISYSYEINVSILATSLLIYSSLMSILYLYQKKVTLIPLVVITVVSFIFGLVTISYIDTKYIYLIFNFLFIGSLVSQVIDVVILGLKRRSKVLKFSQND